MTAQDILKQYFGYDSFRPGQDELVRAILSGRDTLGIMPTGAGKSICYQVPAMLFPGLTLVISPLISLMKDQVGALVEAGVPAACINSAMSAEEFRDALYFAGRGQYKLLYVAPERLTAPSFLEFAQRVPISMITVDEAHCISQWGQDFRPSYLKILDFLAALPERPLVSAFTATATAEVRDDIVAKVLKRIHEGMGLIVLHSGHFSKIFKAVTGCSGSLKWREAGEKERLWNIAPWHPITQGIGEYFELAHEEMYGERFDIPRDAEIIFLSWFEGGNVMRSGFTLERGYGKVFYFQPGHESYPNFYDENVLRVIGNAVRWAKPVFFREMCAPCYPALEEIRSVDTAPKAAVLQNADGTNK